MGKVETATPAQPQLDQTKVMGALVWEGKKDIRYEIKPRPMITDTRDILLKVTASTICGSDLHLYSGSLPDMKPGDILGHEFMGIVIDKGTDVKKINVGQRVVVAFDIACGTCDYCKREEYTACDTTNPSGLMDYMYGHRTAALYGYSHLTGGVPGGQSEYVRVPFADVNCLPIPDDIPDDKALYLSDIVPTSLHGTELGGVKEGTRVGIWGLGPVGLLTARWCQIKKAGRIIAIDCIPERLERAKKLGIETIDFKKEKVVERIDQLCPGGLDVSIECAGFEYAKTLLHKLERAVNLETDTADILSEMIYATRKFGVVSIIGVYSGHTNHFPIGALMEKGLHMTGSQSPTQKYWKYCLEKIRTGEMDPTFVVTHRGTLADGPKLYDKFYNRDQVIKVFLRPEHKQIATSE
jgi:threonine dehydrogenase-like Zn-dependent dehydrogenase